MYTSGTTGIGKQNIAEMHYRLRHLGAAILKGAQTPTKDLKRLDAAIARIKEALDGPWGNEEIRHEFRDIIVSSGRTALAGCSTDDERRRVTQRIADYLGEETAA